MVKSTWTRNVGYAKIHVDAAVSKTRNCGAAAAVCRSNDGNFMGSSALVIHGITDAATLEAITCREGLALAQDLLLNDFLIASDSKQVVNDIKTASNGTYGAIISEIRNLSVGFNCNITFEGRVSNSDADRLAKFSIFLIWVDMVCWAPWSFLYPTSCGTTALGRTSWNMFLYSSCSHFYIPKILYHLHFFTSFCIAPELFSHTIQTQKTTYFVAKNTPVVHQQHYFPL